MFSFIKSLFGSPKPQRSDQTAVEAANASVASYRRRDIESLKKAGFDLTDDQYDRISETLASEADEDEIADELADAFVSAMFDRHNDPLSALPSGTFDFIGIDVETATRDNASICQIGIACVLGDQVKRFVTLIDPETEIDSRNFAIHQIDDDDVHGMPTFPIAIAAMRDLLERNILVQHSNFDRQAFQGACNRYGLAPLSATWGDSINAAKHVWPGLKGSGGFKLSNIASHIGITFDHHDAGEDAWACAQVVIQAAAKSGMEIRDLVLSPPKSTKTAYPAPIKRDANKDGPLCGHCAVFTGSLTIGRAEAANLAASAGIQVVTGVSKKVTLLVVGDQDLTLLAGHNKSSKHRKAEDLIAAGHTIQIIGEAEFISLVTM